MPGEIHLEVHLNVPEYITRTLEGYMDTSLYISYYEVGKDAGCLVSFCGPVRSDLEAEINLFVPEIKGEIHGCCESN